MTEGIEEKTRIQVLRERKTELEKELKTIEREMRNILDPYDSMECARIINTAESIPEMYDQIIAGMDVQPWERYRPYFKTRALNSFQDQIHILRDMKAAEVDLRINGICAWVLIGLVADVNQIHQIFEYAKVPLPQWFQDKYRHMFSETEQSHLFAD